MKLTLLIRITLFGQTKLTRLVCSLFAKGFVSKSSHPQNIIDAIVAGKCAAAEKLMRAHVRRAGELAQLIPGLA